jgi:exosortase family protein XrtF
MTSFSFKEFKPTIFFLVRFLGIYLTLNLLYGWYVKAWNPKPEPVTSWVSSQSAWVLRVAGYDSESVNHRSKPTTLILNEEVAILSVYEGCNGINSGIVFLAFLLAFGPYKKSMIWFVPTGLLVIHLANLMRIILLFFVSIYLQHYLYFTHKYLFTAFIYLVVFGLWITWILKFSKAPNEK